jgi:peptidyl-prolyl cis-trans isomerase A (cyclophilin A)/peptidyl-prolyl cis-trans isomerase B (cyclophilin B)
MKTLLSVILSTVLFATAAVADNPMVKLETNAGTIVVELYPDAAPVTVKNFLDYVNSGFYNNTIFHRVIPDFMIQGGGFQTDYGQKQTLAPIVNEASNGLANRLGSIAMARTNDPNSATAQFFINVADNAFLNYQPDANPGYAVFGQVVEGLDTAIQISMRPTGPGGQFRSDVPSAPVIILNASVFDAD